MLSAGAKFAVLPITGAELAILPCTCIRLLEMCAVEFKSLLSTEMTVHVMPPDVEEDAAMSWLQHSSSIAGGELDQSQIGCDGVAGAVMAAASA